MTPSPVPLVPNSLVSTLVVVGLSVYVTRIQSIRPTPMNDSHFMARPCCHFVSKSESFVEPSAPPCKQFWYGCDLSQRFHSLPSIPVFRYIDPRRLQHGTPVALSQVTRFSCGMLHPHHQLWLWLWWLCCLGCSNQFECGLCIPVPRMVPVLDHHHAEPSPFCQE